MKHIIAIILSLTALAAAAQPPARLRQEDEKKNQSTTPQGVAYRDFPTAQPMPDDAAWRRDIYLSLDLTKEDNAVLYYPTIPAGGRENLFTRLFKLMLRGQLQAYDYKLDGSEDFSEKNKVKARDILDRYHIFYETNGSKIRVNDADLPSEEVKAYFIKVSHYYDQHTASFRSKVTALCPVLKRGGDFGDSESQYPMFWIKYDDAAPQLGKLMLMGSNLNNAATISADDFFTTGAYKGDIYKTTNLQDRLLTQYCETDSAVTREQRRIEKEMTDFQDRMWGRDSVAMAKAAAQKAQADSIAATQKKPSARTARSTGRRTSAGTATGKSPSAKSSAVAQKRQRTPKPKSSPSSSSRGSYSVLRQRH